MSWRRGLRAREAPSWSKRYVHRSRTLPQPLACPAELHPLTSANSASGRMHVRVPSAGTGRMGILRGRIVSSFGDRVMVDSPAIMAAHARSAGKHVVTVV